jgi:hypothetical protein
VHITEVVRGLPSPDGGFFHTIGSSCRQERPVRVA